ncbi:MULTISPECIES: hypothetical protein [Streptomyces]|uniref:Uncharacterized protein n=1 Tax=Streptomyces solicathayae TaxID=3081768 RepID=A0ABZ0LPV3_9ACTN|nr:hypothetical protein [Streptomyces sp. HUAS YS2]WOX21246.1 hypothetical protein R2D22_07565 [Streptomyces sp. HUAS YS2]
MRKSLAVMGASALLALGSGVALAPSASAASAGNAGQTAATAQSSQGEVKSGGAVTKSLDKSTGLAAAAKGEINTLASCWNGSTSGRYMYMTCSGNGYRVYIDCSNGYRYTFPTYYYGTFNHTMWCPSGTYAIWGGSIGG